MEERIIAFMPRMADAIEAEKKTQTRRLCDEDKYHVGKTYHVHKYFGKDVGNVPTNIHILVTDKRWERVQDVGEEDALDEGVFFGIPDPRLDKSKPLPMPSEVFAKLWDTIHAPKSPNGWAANPKVWVIEFRRIY